MTERELQDAIVQTARVLGWRVYHTHDSRHSAAGYPDLTMVRNGRLVFAELKSATGKASEAQQEWLRDLRLSSAEVYMWEPSRWLDGTIERVLR